MYAVDKSSTIMITVIPKLGNCRLAQFSFSIKINTMSMIDNKLKVFWHRKRACQAKRAHNISSQFVRGITTGIVHYCILAFSQSVV